MEEPERDDAATKTFPVRMLPINLIETWRLTNEKSPSHRSHVLDDLSARLQPERARG
jgi:hypothetical protein